MFITFRHRLLFWFLIFISSNLIVILLARQYIQSREKISRSSQKAEKAYAVLLKIVGTQKDFFAYDSKNPNFFIYQTSENLSVFDSLNNVLTGTLAGLDADEPQATPESIRASLDTLEFLFKKEVGLVLKRGYKDFNLEGLMRNHAHWLENKSTLANPLLLTLRRYEKDYIIRNEATYVNRLNELSDKLLTNLSRSNTDVSDSTAYHLREYKKSFNEIVLLDQQSGLKNNSGLKQRLDSRAVMLEQQFENWLNERTARQEVMFKQLTLYYIVLTAILLCLSFIVSLLIARKITRPLTDLTQYITRFVDSNFTVEEGAPPVRSKDEIGKLTQNFTMLKNEVITRLRFFKQKVDERTTELAHANDRLMRLNEANSRFVPKEFLHFLNKPSVEEIKLGDHAECEMTIMFTDIRSFTRISETLSPQENFDFLNNYLSKVVPVIQRHGGFIDKYIGDSVMALFPAKPDQALQAALEIEHAIKDFKRGTQPVLIGTGIHTGKMILGTIGHDHRMDTTVISDAVNIAARVEGLTRVYHATTLVTKDTLSQLENPDQFHLRALDVVKVKGKTINIELFELIDPQDTVKLLYREKFESAVTFMRAGQLQEAVAVFSALEDAHPTDLAIRYFINRCKNYLLHGLPADWDGGEAMLIK